VLIAEGFIRVEKNGNRHEHAFVRAYTQAEDPR